MSRAGRGLRGACLIAAIGASVVGCRSPGARAPARIVDGEAAERAAALRREKLVDALGTPPEGLGKSADPR